MESRPLGSLYYAPRYMSQGPPSPRDFAAAPCPLSLHLASGVAYPRAQSGSALSRLLLRAHREMQEAASSLPGAGTDTGDRCTGSVAPTRAPRGSWLTEWISTVGCPVGTSSSSCGAQHKVDPQARGHISRVTTWCLISSLNHRDP